MWAKVPCDFLFSGARAMSCLWAGYEKFHLCAIATLLPLSSLSSSLFVISLSFYSSGLLWVKMKMRRKIYSKCIYDVSGKRRKSICGQVKFPFWKHQRWVLRSRGGRAMEGQSTWWQKNQFLFQMLKQQTWVFVASDGLLKFYIFHNWLNFFLWTNKKTFQNVNWNTVVYFLSLWK